jgi:hypothetical protein
MYLHTHYTTKQEFMSPNYLANWVQSLFNALGAEAQGKTLCLGGDGRYFGKEASQIIIKLAAGNGFSKVVVGQDAIMATPAMSALIRRRKFYGEGYTLCASCYPLNMYVCLLCAFTVTCSLCRVCACLNTHTSMRNKQLCNSLEVLRDLGCQVVCGVNLGIKYKVDGAHERWVLPIGFRLHTHIAEIKTVISHCKGGKYEQLLALRDKLRHWCR